MGGGRIFSVYLVSVDRRHPAMPTNESVQGDVPLIDARDSVPMCDANNSNVDEQRADREVASNGRALGARHGCVGPDSRHPPLLVAWGPVGIRQ